MEFDLDAMLNSILDDTPLPTQVPVPVTITPQPEKVEEAPPTLADVIAEPVANLATPEQTLSEIGESLADAIHAADPMPFADTEARKDEGPVIGMPTFTSDEIASTLDIRNFATLTTLNTRRWHAKAKDRQASRDAAFASDADESAFETRKHLLAGADAELKRIHKAIDTARAKYYEYTLPWTTTGVTDAGRRAGARLLPNTQFFEFISEMANCKTEMTSALDAFVPAYPKLVEEARKKLGKRFDIREYPNVDSIRSQFDLSFDFQPIPQGQDFKGLPQQQADALANALAGKTRTMLENAMQDLWTRASDAIGRMAERLSHPDKLFHYTLVGNVRSVANQLKHLNVTGDPRIEELRKYVDKNLCGHEVEELRTNNTLRREVGARAQTAMDMMAKIAKGGA
jgi:hypothetical protein